MATWVGVTTPKSPSTTAPTFTGVNVWARAGPACPVIAMAAAPAAALRKPRLVVMDDSPVASRGSPPAAQAPVEMLEEKHDRDGHHRDDDRGGEQLGRPERERHALHLKAHAAIARQHL